MSNPDLKPAPILPDSIIPPDSSLDDTNENDSEVRVTVQFSRDPSNSFSTSFLVDKNDSMKKIQDIAFTRFKSNYNVSGQNSDYMLTVKGAPTAVSLDQKISNNPHINLCHALQLPISFQLISKTQVPNSPSTNNKEDIPFYSTLSPSSTTSSLSYVSSPKSSSKTRKSLSLNRSFQGKKNPFTLFRTKAEGSSQEKRDSIDASPHLPSIGSDDPTQHRDTIIPKSTFTKPVFSEFEREPNYFSSPELNPTNGPKSPAPTNIFQKDSKVSAPTVSSRARPNSDVFISFNSILSPSCTPITSVGPSPTTTVLTATNTPILQTLNSQTFLVRVFLDADASTIVSCPPDATVSFLFEKALKKYSTLHGNTIGSKSKPSKYDMFLMDENYEVIHNMDQALLNLPSMKMGTGSKRTPTFVLLPKEMDPSCPTSMPSTSTLGSPTPFFAFLILPKGLFTYFRIYSLMKISNLADRAFIKLRTALDLLLPSSDLQVSLSSLNLNETLNLTLSHSVILADLGLKSICDPYSNFVTFKITLTSPSFLGIEEKTSVIDLNALFTPPSKPSSDAVVLLDSSEKPQLNSIPLSPFQIRLNLAPDIHAQFYVTATAPCSFLIDEALRRLKSFTNVEPTQASSYQIFFDFDGALRVLNLTQLVGEVHGLSTVLNRGEIPHFMLRLHPRKSDPSSDRVAEAMSIKSESSTVSKSEVVCPSDLDSIQKKTRIITLEDVLRNLQLVEVAHTQKKDMEAGEEDSPIIPLSLLSVEETQRITFPQPPKQEPSISIHIYIQGLKLPLIGSFFPSQTIKNVKAWLWARPELSIAPLKDNKADYVFLYKPQNGALPLLLMDELQWIQSISYVVKEASEALCFHLTKLNRPDEEKKQHLSTILGYPWQDLNNVEDLEVQCFRQRLLSVHFDIPPFSLSKTMVETTPLSPVLISKLIGSRFRIQLRLHFPLLKASKTLACDAHEQVATVVQRVVTKFELNLDPTLYTFKFCGRKEYLNRSHHVIDHTSVRQLVLNDEKIHLILEEEPRSFPFISLNLVDDSISEKYKVEDRFEALWTHRELTLKGKDLSTVHCISLWDLYSNLRIELKRIENLDLSSLSSTESLFIESNILFGNTPISSNVRTHFFPATAKPRVQTYLIFDLPISNIPKNAVLSLTLFATTASSVRKKGETEKKMDITPVGHHCLSLIDFRSHLRQGTYTLALYPKKPDFVWSTTAFSMQDTSNLPQLTIKFEEYSHPVVFPKWEVNKEKVKNKSLLDVPKDEVSTLRRILKYDALTQLDGFSQSLLWKWRDCLVSIPESLPKLLLSTSWHSIESVENVKRFADEDVRNFAIQALEHLSDDEVLLYLMQLIQALSFEPRLDSALARFTLKRALASSEVGHAFFWALRSKLEQPSTSILYSVLLEAFLLQRSDELAKYAQEVQLVNQLTELAAQVKQLKATERQECLIKTLSTKIGLTPSARLPLCPDFEVQNWILHECKCMDSKKVPLKLVFQGKDFADGGEIAYLFKSGDDLRQDMLTLQMLRIMDRIWKESVGLDLKLSIYECICTGKDQGWIQVITEAETVSSIQLAYGGSTAAFKEEPLANWIKSHNLTDYEEAVMNFTLSCAGYCVATYCLGIGDRHNDNIMCSKKGHLFHIDFGHFLGNIKKKFGFKREIAPFVLTPDFLYVITSSSNKENFNFFVSTCVKAFIALRRHSALIIHLFMMMCNSGIPELATYEDIQYLRNSFCLGLSEADAAAEFQNLILLSIRLGWSTQLNWWVHNLVHSK